jgi:ribosome maturation factor RimP
MADLKKLLATANKKWGETVEKAKKSQFVEFEDGPYTALLGAYEIKESQGDNPQYGVLHAWVIQEGDRAGDTKYEWMNMFRDGEVNPFFVQRLEALTGTDAAELDITQVETIYDDVVKSDPVWDFVLKTTKAKDGSGNEYQNLRLKKQREGYEIQFTADGEAADTKEAKGKSKSGKTSSSGGSAKPPAKPKVGSKPEPEKNEPPVEEGDTVSFTAKVKGKETTLEGVVDSVDEDEETITVKSGQKEYTLGYNEVEKLEPAGNESGFEEGDEVKWTVTEGKGRNRTTTEHTGVIDSIDEDAETAEVKEGTGKKAVTHTVSLDDLEKTAEDEENGEDGEGAAFEEGDSVKFSVKVKGKETELTGTVTTVDADDETCEVEDENGKTRTLSFEDLEKVEDEGAGEGEGEGLTFNEGDEVTFEVDGEEKTGKVVEVDNDAETLEVKIGKKQFTVEFSDVKQEADLSVGDRVEFTDPKNDKKQLQGEVTAIDEEEETVKVKVGIKTFTVGLDDITILQPA